MSLCSEVKEWWQARSHGPDNPLVVEREESSNGSTHLLGRSRDGFRIGIEFPEGDRRWDRDPLTDQNGKLLDRPTAHQIMSADRQNSDDLEEMWKGSEVVDQVSIARVGNLEVAYDRFVTAAREWEQDPLDGKRMDAMQTAAAYVTHSCQEVVSDREAMALMTGERVDEIRTEFALVQAQFDSRIMNQGSPEWESPTDPQAEQSAVDASYHSRRERDIGQIIEPIIQERNRLAQELANKRGVKTNSREHENDRSNDGRELEL